MLRYGRDLYNFQVLSDFDLETSMEDFETAHDAKKNRARICTWLAKGDEAARMLSAKLSQCGEERPCYSGACHVCMRRMRRGWSARVASAVRADDEQWTAVSAIPGETFAIGKLNQFDPRVMKARLLKQIKRSQLVSKVALGGIDFSVEIRGAQVVWAPHWYFLIKGSRSDVSAALKKYYPTSLFIRRPFEMRMVDKEKVLRAGSYSLKAAFFLKDRNRPGNWLKPINRTHWLEFAPLLDKWGVIARLIDYGF
ncbi:MAG: hypothetical protein KF854_00895 [Nitrospira sp.]|nr:hypothetical protein [Nitrospira sp.]MBX3513108.1 hypothetical protein [Xanthobacteraceae bacterium]